MKATAELQIKSHLNIHQLYDLVHLAEILLQDFPDDCALQLCLEQDRAILKEIEEEDNASND